MTHLKCYACNLKSHLITNCPRLHYKPDHSFLIKKHIFYSPSTERIIYLKRRKSKSYNARLKIVTISKAILHFNSKEENETQNNTEAAAKTQEEEIEESESALIKGYSSLNYLKEISTPKLNNGGHELERKEALIEKEETLGYEKKGLLFQIKEEELDMLSGKISGKTKEEESGKEGFQMKRRTSRQGFSFSEIGSKGNINFGENLNSDMNIGGALNEGTDKAEKTNFIKIVNGEENLLM